jgi:hypothetical protein
MNALMQELHRQRWDDHRYYHHCRINQSLHLLSALTFIAAYGLLFFDPALAALLAWCVSMTTRQAGHFFFEPRGYDHVNAATDAHKEAVKVGYNIRRKIVLMAAWASMPLLLWLAPGLFGLDGPPATAQAFLHELGIAWLALGVAGLLLRALQLVATRGGLTAAAWVLKILSDPFHDAWLYRGAPRALWRGERFDPMTDGPR